MLCRRVLTKDRCFYSYNPKWISYEPSVSIDRNKTVYTYPCITPRDYPEAFQLLESNINVGAWQERLTSGVRMSLHPGIRPLRSGPVNFCPLNHAGTFLNSLQSLAIVYVGIASALQA